MNLKKIILAFSLLISMNSIAQNEIRIGVKGGVNLSGLHTQFGTTTSNQGLNIGGIFELELNNSLSLYTELLYNKKGGVFYPENTKSSTNISLDTELHYLDIPIQVKFSFLNKLSIDFGPQIGFLLNSKGIIGNSISDNGKEVKFSNTNSIEFALNGGFSYKLSNALILQSRYSYGMTKVFKNERVKNSVISLSIGYFFN
ncbi:porin family protein [Gaetbulibacter sp. M235]|uniref:porin family protein n=1 Tax=Gaetbulibacter sp. M235 TaxID=3126510 RepID=UPI00374F485E